MITLGALNELTGIRHGFFTRNGGVSSGLYASLNCGLGSGDDPAAVATNRARVADRLDLPADRLLTLYQVHSTEPVIVTDTTPWAGDQRPHADALVTRLPGIALAVLSADCAPVLLADRRAGVIAAAHAGWKGALGGVLDRTVQAMASLGARSADITAAVGPCIAQRSYEVGPEFPAPFLAEDGRNQDFFAPSRRAGHSMFDLGGYITRRLAGCGVTLIQRCPCDTAAEEDRFFSYRRSRLRGEPDYGRGISAIVLQP